MSYLFGVVLLFQTLLLLASDVPIKAEGLLVEDHALMNVAILQQNAPPVEIQSSICQIIRVNGGKEDTQNYFSGVLIQTANGHKAILSTADVYDKPSTKYLAVFNDATTFDDGTNSRLFNEFYFYRNHSNGLESLAIGFLESYPEAIPGLVIGTFAELKAAGESHVMSLAGYEVSYPPERPNYFFPSEAQAFGIARSLKNLSNKSLYGIQHALYENEIDQLPPTVKRVDRFIRYHIEDPSMDFKRKRFSLLFCAPNRLYKNTTPLGTLVLGASFSPQRFCVTSNFVPHEGALPIQPTMRGGPLVLKDSSHIVGLISFKPTKYLWSQVFYNREMLCLGLIIAGCALGGHYCENQMAYGVLVPFAMWFSWLSIQRWLDPNVYQNAFFHYDTEFYAPIAHMKEPIEQYIDAHHGQKLGYTTPFQA